jgi:hypothetical protein
MLGGVAVLLRIPWWLVVVPFLVVGLALAVRDLLGVDLRAPGRSVLVIGGLGVVAFVLVALTQSLVGLRMRLGICDDWRAYLPMAHRLIDTYGLHEPWSTRRLQSLGGFDLLQALPVAVFGHVGVNVAETVIAGTFLAGLFVANGMRTTWARVIGVGLIVAVPVLWVPRSNSTGVLMGIPLLVAVFAATAELRSALRAERHAAAVRWAIAGGLVSAALMSVRPNLGLLAVLVLGIGAVSASGASVRGRIQTLVIGGVSTLVAVAPWSLDMWRTAGSPLYPLFPGNLNREAMVIEAPRDVAHLIELATDLVVAGAYLWVTLGVLVVTLAARKLLPDAPLVAIGGAATLIVTIVFALNTPFAPDTAFVRYIAPMSEALALFLVCEMLRGAEALPSSATVRRGSRTRVVLAVTASIALVGLAFVNGRIYFDLGNRPGGADLLGLAIRDDLERPAGQELTTAALRDSYRRALARAGADGTIVAVDRPYLIDYRRYDVPNLDAPGYMSPDGRFPFFTGPGPKIARLRRGGYDTLIATDPVSDLCLNPDRLEVAARLRPYDAPRYSRFLDWGHDIQAIARRAPLAVHRFGDLLVIDLARAQRDLART